MDRWPEGRKWQGETTRPQWWRCSALLCGVLLSTAFAVAPAVAADVQPVCPPPGPGQAQCLSEIVTATEGAAPAIDGLGSVGPDVSGGPSAGFAPSDLQSAYGFASQTASSGAAQTVALVDAYDDPTAEGDLAAYRSYYGLSPCTTANGCFRKVNETGGTSYPAANTGWATEISLDVDAVSALCPHCHILLVEATTNNYSDLWTAEGEAVTLGATEISNSYGGAEFSGEASDDRYYNHPGIAITVSSGDDGYGVDWPASSPDVTAVGGTSLTRASGTARGWSETAWSDAGSGCSAYEPKPSWQTDSGCGRRAEADVSADANPSTGAAVYDTSGEPGWVEVGGTSLASPLVAAADALVGSATATPGFPYSHSSDYNDVTAGSNGSCAGSYLCTASVGYDGPTGLGSPNGAELEAAVKPGVTVGASSNLTSTSVDLNASISAYGSPTTYQVQYGPSTSYGSVTPIASAGSNATPTSVSIPLSGLAPGASYHFKLTATDANGSTSSPDETFTLPALQAPTVSPGSASSSSATGAVLNATIDPDASATTYQVRYGTGPAYGSLAPTPAASAGTDQTGHPVSVSLTGLTPNTTYHFQFIATSVAGTTSDADATFTTAAAPVVVTSTSTSTAQAPPVSTATSVTSTATSPPISVTTSTSSSTTPLPPAPHTPQVVSASAASATPTSVVLRGVINPHGSPTTYVFRYGTTAAYGHAIPLRGGLLAAATTSRSVQVQLNGLKPGTTYRFELVATSAGGASKSVAKTFTTPTPAAARAAARRAWLARRARAARRRR